MRLVALFTIFTFIALAIQTTASRWLPLNALVPDLILILAVDLGLRHRRALAPIMAFAMGYAMDAFSGSQLGINTFIVTLVFLMAYEEGRLIPPSGPRSGAMLVFVAVLVQNLVGLLISTQFRAPNEVWTVIPSALLQAAVTAALAPPIFGLMDNTKRLVGLGQRGTRRYASRGA